CAGDEFLATRLGNNNPYNQDNDINYLDWELVEKNADMFRFFQGMIAFRKQHPSIGRSHFWREDICWYGTNAKELDFSRQGQAFSYCLHGTSVPDDDIYVLMNSSPEPVDFVIQEGKPADWRLVADTDLKAPADFVLPEKRVPLGRLKYRAAARSVVVFCRPGSGQ
ncbi:MAG: glycogen debranching enzyme GlgX, partial [Bryobacterales bacterium]|nr:glycogen debranching enzyme GlgX [Bryobacterales bacterium]